MVFDGAKLALYLGEKLAVILRDDLPGLLFADHWDLPGGGRRGMRPRWPARCANAAKNWGSWCLKMP